MGIDVALVNERHEPTEEVYDPRQYLTSLATGQWPRLDGSVCLRFIDPWGDTVFNQAQIPVLLAELERSAASQTNAEIKAHLQKICRLVAKAKDQTHMYIKFTGD
ncbi:MAG TPA: hypothetical protein VEN78_28015 [Bradyrhizobium sp.]|nr:hypothetical protein [Bradyrhizobium sp.]